MAHADKYAAMKKLMEAHAARYPRLTRGLQDKLAGLQTAQSAEFDKSFHDAINDELDIAYKNWKAANPNSTPQQDGQFVGDFMQRISNMPDESKWALGLGVPLALIGLGSAIFGGGGMGSLLMTVAGVAAAGMGAANAGFAGPAAQQFAQNSFGQIASGLGFGGETGAAKAPTSAPATAASPTAATASSGNTQVSDPNAVVARAHEIMNSMGYGYGLYAPEADKNQIAELLAAPEDQLMAMHNKLTPENSVKLDSILHSKAADIAAAQSANPAAARANLDRARRLFPKKASVIDIMLKAARCWAGYEPVPGSKPYTEGSCRPKGSKKTQKEVAQGKKHEEKKAYGPRPSRGANPYNNPDFNQKGEYVGAYSSVPFDSAHARQWLGLSNNDQR
ncbi:MAG: hypothetical protein EBX37_16480, partial [Alphaproteobacteria bacterium]|nr:hypothetical protein [Alphaproteobacteria bacterium]